MRKAIRYQCDYVPLGPLAGYEMKLRGGKKRGGKGMTGGATTKENNPKINLWLRLWLFVKGIHSFI